MGEDAEGPSGFLAEQLVVLSACVELVSSTVERLDNVSEGEKKLTSAADAMKLATVELDQLGSEMNVNRAQGGDWVLGC